MVYIFIENSFNKQQLKKYIFILLTSEELLSFDDNNNKINIRALFFG